MDDILARLDAALGEWESPVTETHDDLAEEIAKLEAEANALASEKSGAEAADPEALQAPASGTDESAQLVAELDQERDQAPEPIAQQKVDLEARDAVETGHDASEQALHKELDEARAELEKAREQIAQLKTDLEVRATAETDRDASEQALHKDLDEARTELEKAREQIAQLKTDLEARATAETGRDASEQALHKDLDEARAELEKAREQIAQLKSDLDNAGSEAAALQEQARVLADRQVTPAQAAANAAKEETLREELDKVRAELANAHADLQRAHTLSGNVEELKNRHDAEHARAEAVQTQLESYTREHEEARAAATREIKTAIRERDEAVRELQSLRSELQILRQASANMSVPAESPAAKDLENTTIEVQDAEGHKLQLGEILINMGVITPENLQAALREQAHSPQRRLGAFLVEKGLVSEEVVARILAQQMKLPFIRLTTDVVDADAPKLINGQLAKRRMCIPISKSSDHMVLAMANPGDLIAIDDITLASKLRVEPVVATGADIAAAIVRYYNIG